MLKDKFAEVLQCYDFDVRMMSRARGAFLLETNQGLKLLKNLDYSEKKLALEQEVTKFLSESSFQYVDCIVKNKEGMLITTDGQGERYIVKNWFLGKECNAREKEDILEGMRTLARLHSCLQGHNLPEEIELPKTTDIRTSLEKHTRELKRVNSYIRNKKKKNEFEISILDSFETFYSRAEKALDSLEDSMYEEQQIIHGSYTYHNILCGDDFTAVVNFERADYNSKVVDLYYFFRKVMEKNNWKLFLGEELLEEYQKYCSLSKNQWNLLGILLAYPEKYWKIVNHYYNNKKCWTANKNVQKLDAIREQEWQKNLFLQKVFSLSF